MNENENSKRQKFYELMKRTKDVYIPNLKNTITARPGLLESALGDTGSDLATAQFPLNMYIQHYPSYYTSNLLAGNGKTVYDVVLRLNTLEPGDATRKRNRILLSLCKQYMKDNSVPPADVPSVASAESSSDIDSHNQVEYDTLNHRIKGFLCKRIPNVPLRIRIYGSQPGEQDEIQLKTDNIGYVETSFMSSFEPQVVKINVETPPDYPYEVTKTITNLSYIKQGGWGLISDIDDTIKHTGVTGDKRSMFRNVFVHDFERWRIDGMPTWYHTLNEKHNFDFFYVSNSPLQLFPVLSDFVLDNYPIGPIFLKQYTGNFLTSLMTSSANRKLGKIRSILEDFPDKSFVLVGDSGEQDLEAYVELATEFPKQIKAIFIRCCSNSLSDDPVNDSNVMKTLNDIIVDYYLKEISEVSTASKTVPIGSEPVPNNSAPPLPTRSATFPLLSENQDSYRINTDTKFKRRPPPIPKRKPQLSEGQEMSIREARCLNSKEVYNDNSKSHLLNTDKMTPALPPRRTESSLYDTVCDKNSLSPSASTITMSSSSHSSSLDYFVPSSQNDVEAVSQPIIDKRAENWENRVSNAINNLLAANSKVHFAFFMNPESCLEDTLELLEENENQLTK